MSRCSDGDNEEEKPFLDESGQQGKQRQRQGLGQDHDRILSSSSSSSLSTFKLIAGFSILQIILIAIYTTVSILYLARYSPSSISHSEEPLVKLSPLKDLNIQWIEKRYATWHESSFTGLPSQKTDEAWSHLIENMTIRVTKEELDRSGQQSVELPDGGGYMAWMGVHHELHCIKYLREFKYSEHYHPSRTEIEKNHASIHADHCIEMLRSAAICRPDTSLTTFHWDKDARRPMLNIDMPSHACVDYDGLMESVRMRVVGLEESSRLRNPNAVIGSSTGGSGSGEGIN